MDLLEELEDNEIFDNGENLDESNEAIQTNQEENQDDDQEEKKDVKPKRVIKRPRAKLNAELLTGPKGLRTLEKCFERVQFKGKGNEEQDLNVLLKTYEYWCHRLFPKYPFKDCIDRVERLGSKGPIQTYLKKVRSGLIDDDDENPDVLPDFRSDEEDEPDSSNIAQSSSQAAIMDIPIELTEEQLETIRRNREKAEKLRQERLRKIQEKASINLPDTNIINQPSTSNIRSITELNVTNQSDASQTNSENINSENPSEDQPGTSNILSHCNEDEGLQEKPNDENSDSEGEIQFTKKSYKKVFDDDDEDDETRTELVIEKTNGNEEQNSISPKNNDDNAEEMEVDL